jgi:fatty-acyl-CoA synthase
MAGVRPLHPKTFTKETTLSNTPGNTTGDVTASRAILIDREMGPERASLVSAADVAAVEAVPLAQRLEAASTYEAIQIGARHNPDAPAIQFLPTCSLDEAPLVVSHAQFLARVTQAANLFGALGVGPSDVVSLLLPLLPQSFYALYGAEAAGIANPVNPLLEPHQLAEILNAAQTKVVVVLGPTAGSDIWDKVQRIRHQVPSLKTILVVGGEPLGAEGMDAKPVPGQQVLAFDAELAKQPGDRLVSGRQIQRQDIAAYFHTGGTTGTPKLVRHTHENQVYQAWVCNVMLNSGPGKPMLFGLPLYHVGGALTQGLSGLAAGGSLVVLSASGWRNATAVKNVWKLIERFQCPVFGGVPTVLAAAAAIPWDGVDLSCLKAFSGGGSAIPVAVGEKFQRHFGLPVLEVYGMTETASVHTISYLDRPLRLGTVGHAVPYSRVRVVRIDANGKLAGDCAVNEIGVVAMAGPGVFGGYLNEIHNQNAFVEPGWVNSGDLGRLDEDGYLWITGRAKDLIIRGGHNIDPMPIEEAFYQHPAVALAAVIGQPDAYAGELPVAYVQLKPGASATAAELHDWVRARTPERAAIPVQVRLIDAIPLTGVGKVFKPQLRWDAAQAVFANLLAPLAAEGAAIQVKVAADGTHGTLASISLAATGWDSSARAGLETEVRALMAPFTIRYQITWAP